MNRIFVEKKAGHNAEARHLLRDLHESLVLPGLKAARIVQRYDIDGLTDEEFNSAARLILSEPQVDSISETLSIAENETAFAVEFLPGQFDQRADSAAQCVQILTGKERPAVFSAKVILLAGALSADEITRIKNFVINAVDSHEVPVAAITGRREPTSPPDVAILAGFATHNPAALRTDLGLPSHFLGAGITSSVRRPCRRRPLLRRVRRRRATGTLLLQGEKTARDVDGVIRQRSFELAVMLANLCGARQPNR